MTGMIDLRSDTMARPNDAMWDAMREASLGDDTLEGDATVQALEQEASPLLGKEAALFVCSGTMGNVLATLVHAPRRRSDASRGSPAYRRCGDRCSERRVLGTAGVMPWIARNNPCTI